jgi:hypothetical protein
VRSRVELFEQIRRDRRIEQLSIRELGERHGVHRRTVRQALESAVPPPRKDYPRRPRPALDAWVLVIDEWLLAAYGDDPVLTPPELAGSDLRVCAVASLLR